jgi:hypothetical protein
MGCTSEQHRMHICELKKRGDTEALKARTANAMVECNICGAKAADPEDVCDPVELPDIKDVGDAPEVR